MNWVLDLIIVAIILLFTIVMANKGFVKTVISFLGFIAALLIAFFLCGPVADFAYDKAVGPAIQKTVYNAVDDEFKNGNNIEKSIQESSIPQIVKDKLANVDFDSYGNKSEEIADAVCEKVVKPLSVGLIKVIAFILLFVILSIIAKILANAINKLFSFSVVGKVNKFFGGILGIIYGIVFAALFIMLVNSLVSINGDIFGINKESIEATYIFKNFMAYMPFNVKF